MRDMTQTKPETARTLGMLHPGEQGVIQSVGSRRGPVKRRLVDMGLTPGTRIHVRKIAPFGDPIEVTIRGYELSLRKEDASEITLCPEGKKTRKKRIWNPPKGKPILSEASFTSSSSQSPFYS